MNKRSPVITVCLHPAIDRTLEVPTLRGGDVVRGRRVMLEAAGKGVNVAHTLGALGCATVAAGFVGHREVVLYEESFEAQPVTCRLIPVEAATRDNLTIIEKDTGRDRHIIDSPMKITRGEVAALLRSLRGLAKRDACVVFSGSSPKGVRQADFVDMLRTCIARKARVAVDSSGGLLRAAMRVGPWLVKPNADELAELTRMRVASSEDARAAATKLLTRCGMVLVSLGAEGAMLVTPEGAWRACLTRKVRVTHTVGCGDALLAGFVGARAEGQSPEEALKQGVACGSACVGSPYACIRSREEMTRILPRTTIHAL